MGFLSKLFGKKKKDENEIPPSTWLPTPPPVTDYDRNTPKITITSTKDLSRTGKTLATSGIISVPKDKNHNTLGEPLDRLNKDGELPWGWVAYNKSIIQQIDTEISHFRNEINAAKGVLRQYAALKSYVLYLKDGYNHYSKIGECEGKYFNEFIVKSQESIDNIKHYKYIEDNIDELLKIEELKENMKRNIISLITNNDGILQTDIYKSYPQELKDTVIEHISELCSNGVIYKEKSGRTYALHLSGSKSLPQ